jgi:hypothetical protein
MLLAHLPYFLFLPLLFQSFKKLTNNAEINEALIENIKPVILSAQFMFMWTSIQLEKAVITSRLLYNSCACFNITCLILKVKLQKLRLPQACDKSYSLIGVGGIGGMYSTNGQSKIHAHSELVIITMSSALKKVNQSALISCTQLKYWSGAYITP